MAHVNKVLRSVNAPGDQLCVDVFRSPQGLFGFAEYRRDPEDGSGWYPTGNTCPPRFALQTEAEEAARSAIAWLGDAL